VDGPTTRLRLRVGPGASRPGVVGRYGDRWKVRVAEPPEHGKANEAVVALLASTLELSEADVEIVGGRASRDKTVLLRGVSTDEVEGRLAAVAGAAA
jgi:uncharacterized protein (TIGR00251 family)